MKIVFFSEVFFFTLEYFFHFKLSFGLSSRPTQNSGELLTGRSEENAIMFHGGVVIQILYGLLNRKSFSGIWVVTLIYLDFFGLSSKHAVEIKFCGVLEMQPAFSKKYTLI